jgi:predicted Zn-dependent protease
MTPEALFERAATLMLQHNVADAKTVLQQLVSGMPATWSPVQEGEKTVAIAYWDRAEFVECSMQDGSRHKKDILWTSMSYTHAWYLLAFVAIEEKDAKQAELAIDKALALEPDRALLLNEKATILQQASRFDEAAAVNRKAIESHRCTNAATHKTDLSRAWRLAHRASPMG